MQTKFKLPTNRFGLDAREYTLAQLAVLLRWNSRKPAVVEFIANILEGHENDGQNL